MPTAVVKDWAQRKATDNDAHLRNAFTNVLTESMAQPPDERLVMYDACDEVR